MSAAQRGWTLFGPVCDKQWVLNKKEIRKGGCGVWGGGGGGESNVDAASVLSKSSVWGQGEREKERKVNSVLSTWDKMLFQDFCQFRRYRASLSDEHSTATPCSLRQRYGTSKSVFLSHKHSRKIKGLEILWFPSFRKNYDNISVAILLSPSNECVLYMWMLYI